MARGGARPGAGRPKGTRKSKSKVAATERALTQGKTETKTFADALEFAMATINDPTADLDGKIRLAIAAMPFQHPKIADVKASKKDAQHQAAKEASKGKFAPAAPPKLVVNNK
jgi:hypothetical protein